jgi:hypothetical protein
MHSRWQQVYNLKSVKNDNRNDYKINNMGVPLISRSIQLFFIKEF